MPLPDKKQTNILQVLILISRQSHWDQTGLWQGQDIPSSRVLRLQHFLLLRIREGYEQAEAATTEERPDRVLVDLADLNCGLVAIVEVFKNTSWFWKIRVLLFCSSVYFEPLILSSKSLDWQFLHLMENLKMVMQLL